MQSFRTARAALIATLAGAACSAHGQTWLGGDGLWTDPANWDSGEPNNISAVVHITGGNTTLNVTRAVGELTIDEDDSLSIIQGGFLNVGSRITNNGLLRLADTGSGSATLRLNGSTTLDGAGTLLFDSANTNNLSTTNDNFLLSVGQDQTITTSAGSFGTIDLNLVLAGTLSADAGRIDVAAGQVTTNNGNINATNGGNLNFLSTGTINNNGVLRADAGSTITFSNATINGGALSGAGTFDFSGNHTWNAITLNTDTLTLDQGNQATITGGTLTNNTDLRLADMGSGSAIIRLDAVTALNGTGSITFDSANTNTLNTTNDNFILTVGENQVITTSQDSFGTIDLNAVFNGDLIADNGRIDVAAGQVTTNNSTNFFGATNSGSLNFLSTTTVNNAGATITADAGSQVSFTNTTLNGGNIAGGGTLELAGNHTFNGVTLDIANVNVDQGNQVTLNNGLTNNTTITLNDSGSGSAILRLDGGSQAIDGNGTILIAGTQVGNTLNTTNDNFRLNLGAGQTIRTNNDAQGTIDLNIDNDGLISADNGRINFAAGQNIVNNNTVQATGDGFLDFASSFTFNNNGTFAARDADSTINFTNTTVNGGTISGAGTLELSGNHTFSGVTLDIANINVVQGNQITLTNGLTNNTTITLNDRGSGSAILRLDGASQTIGGNGTILFGGTQVGNTLNTTNDNFILTLGAGQQARTEAGSTGNFDLNSIIDGSVTADNGTINYAAGQTTNINNALTAVNGGAISFATSSVINNSGLFAADESSQITLNGSTVNNGSISGDGALRFTGTSTFNNVTLDIADVVVRQGQTVNLNQSFTNNTALNLSDEGSGSAILRLNSTPLTLDGDGEIVFASENVGNIINTVNDNFTLTIGQDQTVRTADEGSGLFDLNSVVLGRVVADNGVVRYAAGQITTNNGVIEAINGGVVDFATSSRLEGSQAYAADTTSQINLSSATSNAATFAGEGLLNLSSGTSTFNDATINIAETRINNGTAMALTGNTTLNGDIVMLDGVGANAVLRLNGVTSLNGTGSIVFGTNQGNFVNTANDNFTLTIGSGITVRADQGNQGVIDLNADLAGTFDIDGLFVVQSGHRVTVTDSGLITGNGTLDVDQTSARLINSGTIAPGGSTGTLTILGSVENNAGSRLAVEIGGTAEGITSDLLVVSQNFEIGANLDLVVDFVGQAESLMSTDMIRIVDADTLSGGTFFNSISLVNDSEGSFQVVFDEASGDIFLTGFTDIVVPAPSALALLTLSLAAPTRRR